MRHGEGDRLGDGRVRQQDLVDLARRDLLAAAVDDLLETAGQVHVALVILVALVAGAEPAVVKDDALAVGLFS